MLAVGALGVFSFVAAQSYLPTLVRQEGLVEANSKLQLSQSAAGIGASGVGGWLIELVSAPLVLLLYSVSLIISAVMTGLIQKPEPAQQRSVNQGDVWREIGEGIRLIWQQPLLRFPVVAPGVASLGWGVQSAVFVLFVVQDLGVTPAMLGLNKCYRGHRSICRRCVIGRGHPAIRAWTLDRTWATPDHYWKRPHRSYRRTVNSGATVARTIRRSAVDRNQDLEC